MNETVDWTLVERSLRGEDMATTKTAAEAGKTLVGKLAEVMGLMRNVPKEGFNKAQSYRYVREDDVARMASELLAERGIWIHQTVLETITVDLYKTSTGNLMRMTTVRMRFKFIDASGEETEPQEFVGTGADTGDKGIYKAMTGAEKYFLMKSFLISTGDDPEGDEKVDKTAAATEASAGRRTVVAKADHGKVERGGKTANANAAQLAEVKRLARELGVTSQTEMMALVKRVLEAAGAVVDWETPEEFAAFMTGMTSVALGGLVVNLQAMIETAHNTEEPAEEEDPTVDVSGDLDLD
jgi:hypothetical protein